MHELDNKLGTNTWLWEPDLMFQLLNEKIVGVDDMIRWLSIEFRSLSEVRKCVFINKHKKVIIENFNTWHKFIYHLENTNVDFECQYSIIHVEFSKSVQQTLSLLFYG
jgi:hypothetical protein